MLIFYFTWQQLQKDKKCLSMLHAAANRIKELYLEIQKGYHKDVEVLEDVNNMAKELGLDKL